MMKILVPFYKLTAVGTWAWWWPSGQRSFILLQRSEFESPWLLNFLYERTKINEKEAGVGPSFLTAVGTV